MSNPLLASEESSFEQGISVTKPIKSVVGQTQQQAKKFTDDFLAQLYGPSKPTPKEEQDEALKQAGKEPEKQKPYVMGGTANVGDHAKYAMREAMLEKGEHKKADASMHHMQYYFDTYLGTLEDNAKKARSQEEQKKQQKLQEEEEEKRRKEEEEEKKNAEIPRANAKGRNRMGPTFGGKKPKSGGMAVQMGQFKAEKFRGASG